MRRAAKVGAAIVAVLVVVYYAVKAWFMTEPKPKKSPVDDEPTTLLGTVRPNSRSVYHYDPAADEYL
jgi:hypothetical protein